MCTMPILVLPIRSGRSIGIQTVTLNSNTYHSSNTNADPHAVNPTERLLTVSGAVKMAKTCQHTMKHIYNNIFWIRYDMRCYFNVRSIADISQLNLLHGTKVKSGQKIKSKKRICSAV